MTKSYGETIGKMLRWRWTLTILGASSSAVMLWNFFNDKSPILGLPISLLLFYVGARALGSLFFSKERPFVKEVLGFAMFVSIVSLLGIALIFAAVYTDTFSLIGFTALLLGLCVVSGLKGSSNQILPKPVKSTDDHDRTSLVLVSSYIVLTALAFYSLFLARTGEGGISVWLRIPSYFLLLFFLSSLCLGLILFSSHIPTSLKLLLICVNSFLAHSLFLIVWYPGRFGDPWGYLSQMRFIDKEGAMLGYSELLRKLSEDIVRYQALVIDMVKYEGMFSLVILTKRTVGLDMYWVDFVLIPLLWSLLVPVSLYKVAESMVNNEERNLSFPLLTAMGGGLISTLVYWGALAHANTVGFIFLLFSVVLLFKWFLGGERKFWVMSFVVSVLALLTHPQPGIFAFIFLFGATVLKTRLPAILKGLSYFLFFLGYPVLLYMHEATFSMSGLVNLENFLSFLPQMVTLLSVLLFVGLLFSIKSKRVKREGVALLFLFYVTVLTGYYVTSYGMANLPYSSDRIIAITDMLSIPLVALGLLMTVSFLRRGFSILKGNRLKNVNPRAFGIVMICLFLSTQTTLALYSAYPRNDPPVEPAWYEIEAAYYIDSTPGKYIVLCEPGFANLAIGFLGSDYAYGSGRGTFGVPDWNWWVAQASWEMETNPSLDILLKAMQTVGATVGYVVVSVRLPEGYDLRDIVERVSGVLPVDRVFGDGKLYVFKYSAQQTTGQGPNIKVKYDNGSSEENVATEFSSSFVNDVKYTLPLSGHSNYNITEYPTYWTFSALYVNQELSSFDNSSDINDFIYVSGLGSTDVLQVVWQANNLYKKVGWKEDSFKSGWQTGTARSTISTDGNILEISWDFVPGVYYYAQCNKHLNVSTDSYPYLFLKWRTTGPIAEVVVSYGENGGKQQAILGYGSESPLWTVTMVKLLPGENLTSITLAITSYKDVTAISGLQTLYVDYILISAKQ